ncbi:MAG: hypothetical protein ACI9LX_003248 [Paraglaciecola sp.]
MAGVAALAYVVGSSYKNTAAADIVGCLVSTTANALVKEVTFLLVADIEIKEKRLKV